MTQNILPLLNLSKRRDFAPFIFNAIDQKNIATNIGAFIIRFHNSTVNIEFKELEYFQNIYDKFYDKDFLNKIINQIPKCTNTEIVVIGYHDNAGNECSEMIIINRPTK